MIIGKANLGIEELIKLGIMTLEEVEELKNIGFTEGEIQFTSVIMNSSDTKIHWRNLKDCKNMQNNNNRKYKMDRLLGCFTKLYGVRIRDQIK